eukprot:scaffold6338_cov152-Skeletonema_menzelii.AAC.6
MVDGGKWGLGWDWDVGGKVSGRVERGPPLSLSVPLSPLNFRQLSLLLKNRSITLFTQETSIVLYVIHVGIQKILEEKRSSIFSFLHQSIYPSSTNFHSHSH